MVKTTKDTSDSVGLRRVYWILLAATGTISGVALIEQIAMFATILTLGLAFLAIIAASWLFIALLAIMPAVIVKGWLPKITAFSMGAACIIGAIAAAPLFARFDEFLLPEIKQVDNLTLPVTIDISEMEEMGCDTICWRLLSGKGVERVRVSPKLAYQRVHQDTCRQLDPAFPQDAACITPVTPPPEVPALRLENVTDTFEAQDPNFWVRPVERSTLRVMEFETVRSQGSSLKYQERMLWPIFTFFDKSGTAAYRRLERWRSTPEWTAITAMEALGAEPAAAPATMDIMVVSYKKRVTAPRPQDGVLVASGLIAGFSNGDPHFATDLKRFFLGLHRKEILSDFDRELIETLARDPSWAKFPGLGSALSLFPGVAKKTFSTDELFRQVDSNQAAILLARRLVAEPPGTFASKAEAYRAIIDKGYGEFYEPLMNAVGRMGFDPSPYLTAWRKAEGQHPRKTLVAACYSARQWDDAALELARDYLDRERLKSGGGAAAAEALRILASRGKESEVDAWFAQVVPPDYVFDSNRMLSHRGKEQSWRTWLRKKAFEQTCEDR